MEANIPYVYIFKLQIRIRKKIFSSCLDIYFCNDLEGRNSWTPQRSETGWGSAGMPPRSSLHIHPFHPLSLAHHSEHGKHAAMSVVCVRTEFEKTSTEGLELVLGLLGQGILGSRA